MRSPDTPLALVVANNPALCRSIDERLRRGGFRCEIVPLADRALELWRCNQHDLVILDQAGCTQSNLAFCSKIRSFPQGQHTPFLLLCDQPAPDAAQALLALEGCDFLALPLADGQLLPKARCLVRAARTQAALASSLEQLREVQLLARIGLWTWLPEQALLCFDDNAALLFSDLAPREVPLEQFLALLHPDDRDTVRNAFFELAWGGEHRVEYRLRAGNGQLHHVSQRGSSFLRRGEVQFTGVLQDVTGQRRAVERVELLQAALDALPFRIDIADRAGTTVYRSTCQGAVLPPAAQDLPLCDSRGEILGRLLLDPSCHSPAG